MFSGVVNPCTGKLEWVRQDGDVTSETADISRELARSQYGDMLHDKQRNVQYQRGLELAIAEMRASGREPHVLDIGTGTGLLSMMAAKAGAARVTACEVMRPMVQIARRVISQNGYSDVIKVCPKRSTEMSEEDMPSRANILVTEVFDTELIGEGALLTFAHAHKNLMEPNSVVIPSSSKMYVRLVESDFLWKSHKINPDKLPGNVRLPPSYQECPGSPSVWDLHVEEVTVPGRMRLLSDSTTVASFQFGAKVDPSHLYAPVRVPVTSSGTCHGVVIWWDMELGDRTLSMDPWDYPQWRDHWLQAVQLWPQPVKLTEGEEVKVGLRHDNYSIWFTMERINSADSAVVSVDRPMCTCGLHTACGHSRLHMYNDMERTSLYMQALSEALADKSTVVCVSDGCLWPLLLLTQERDQKLPPRHFYYLSNSTHATSFLRELVDVNNLSSSITFLEKTHTDLTSADFAGDGHIEAIIGEPYFSSSLLPWHNLHFWYAVDSVRRFLAPGQDNVVLPGKGALMAIAVNLAHLYNLRAPVGHVEGFDITAFDEAVGKHTTTPEGIEAEPHPLWEYPSYPRSSVYNLMSFDFSTHLPSKSQLRGCGEILLNQQDCPCHAVVLWMEYALTDTTVTSTGLKQVPGSKSEKLEWDPSCKQGVYFLSPKDVGRGLKSLKYHVEFSTTSGNLEMTFSGI